MKTRYHEIAEGTVPYIIAEIGLNHNGQEELALRMIEEASRSGAHCVKFQLYKTELFIDSGSGGESVHDFFRQFELSADAWKRLARAADANGVDFLCSVFDAESLCLYRELLDQAPSEKHLLKIASTDLTNRILLEQARAMGFGILLSTGASSEEEVARTLQWIGKPAVLFQCVSSYPADPSDYNLNLLPAWKERYGCQVGVSDHCESLTVSVAAAAMGAVAIERHFTIDRGLPGPDQALSSTPDQLRELRQTVEIVQAAKGNGIKSCTDPEQNVRLLGRRSLFYSRSLSAGHRLELDDILALRPGDGVPVDQYTLFMGRVLKHDVQAGGRLDPGDFT